MPECSNSACSTRLPSPTFFRPFTVTGIHTLVWGLRLSTCPLLQKGLLIWSNSIFILQVLLNCDGFDSLALQMRDSQYLQSVSKQVMNSCACDALELYVDMSRGLIQGTLVGA